MPAKLSGMEQEATQCTTNNQFSAFSTVFLARVISHFIGISRAKLTKPRKQLTIRGFLNPVTIWTQHRVRFDCLLAKGTSYFNFKMSVARAGNRRSLRTLSKK